MKITPEEAAKVLGVPVREVVAVDAVDVGAVVTGTDRQRLLIADPEAGLDAALYWYGEQYVEKPPNDRLPVYDPSTKTTFKPKPPPKKS
jgi:hypothetical protein